MKLDENDRRIRAIREGVVRAQVLAQRLLRNGVGHLSDDLIAERRREAAKAAGVTAQVFR